MTGLVFDLRDNPGGLFGQGVAVADLFLDAGTIVSAKVRGGRGDRRFDARAGDILEGRPIVVLVNGGSASSSEIVAAALQDHGRAVVLGEVSVGKGSIQKLRRLSETSAIKLTFARFHAPSGETIDTRGVIPDVSIEQVASGLRDEGEDDRALRRAVAVLATACAMPEGCSENIRQALATAAPPHERP
jgi:carboxyl-terminal processing protease